MEESKGSGPPSEQLTREQVMAQRAEKKKLKEARKNKSATGEAGGGGGGGGENKDKASAKPKKPQQQQQQQQTPKAKPMETPKSEVDPPKAAPKQQKQKQQQQQQQLPKPPAASTPKVVVEKPVEDSSGPKGTSPSVPAESAAPLSKSASGASVPEGARSTDKSTITKCPDFHSTIQSLFRSQKEKASKDKAFQQHALFYNLAVKLKNNVIRGANLRCIKLLTTMKDFIEGYTTPPGSTFKHGVTTDLEANLDALRRKCPFAIGMSNAVEYFFAHMYNIKDENKDITTSKEDAKSIIDQYIEEKIGKAVEAIVDHGKDSIQAGDVIMIYSITEALLNLLDFVANKGISFELIIIQTPETMADIPLLLQKLHEAIEKQTVTISSVNFSSAIYRMRYSTKLIIGGHGLFTTGGVMAQSGSGKLALLASTYNKPAIFLCETFKFCDRSPLDFFTLDEYVPLKYNMEDDVFEPKIKYDVTPANLVTVVITDIDLLPSTSVPVVLRVQEGRSPRKDDSTCESP